MLKSHTRNSMKYRDWRKFNLKNSQLRYDESSELEESFIDTPSDKNKKSFTLNDLDCGS